MKHTDFLRRTWAEIDLAALRENYALLRGRVPAGAGTIAVVKADAYGHGADAVARELEAMGANAFAVSNLDEGIALREAGVTAPVLILGVTPPIYADQLEEYGITAAVNGLASARALSETGARVSVHVKFETGMGRLGIPAREPSLVAAAAEEALRIAALPGITVTGAFTHFSTADEPDDALTVRQYGLFRAVCDAAEASGLRFATRHCCNSAAAMRRPEFALDAVRLGIALYGCVPDSAEPSLFSDFPLKPVMTLKSVVSQVEDYPAGATVSYGARRLDRPARIAVVGLGYADGFSRSLSDRGLAVLGGRLCPVVGRVCMDMTMFDVTDAGPVRPGDEAVIIGGPLSAERVAALCGTINYEVLCRVGRRVPRVFRNAL
ncbi:MAG: alanine racemase [Oscillospiraceae bacterium]|nr:alanine racemase [Oscillospiraceae bacterium]